MLNAMDVFNIVAGLVTIASLIFAAMVYFEARKKEAVEKERISLLIRQLGYWTGIIQAIQKQAILLASISDREETTKKELKHLSLAVLASVEALDSAISTETRVRDEWKFGIPSRYVLFDSAREVTSPEEQDPTKH